MNYGLFADPSRSPIYKAAAACSTAVTVPVLISPSQARQVAEGKPARTSEQRLETLRCQELSCGTVYSWR